MFSGWTRSMKSIARNAKDSFRGKPPSEIMSTYFSYVGTGCLDCFIMGHMLVAIASENINGGVIVPIYTFSQVKSIVL